MSDSTSHSHNGLPMHQPSIASSVSSQETRSWPTTLSAVVMPAASFETWTLATMEDVKLPWNCVDGGAAKKSDRTMQPSWMLPCGVAKKPDEATSSSEEDDEDDLREDVDFAVGITLKWLRREEKEKEERNKRKAEEHAEEDKKRRATEGYRPAFIIDIDGVPLEEVETARRLATVAAAEDLSQWNGEDNKNNTERSALR